MNIEETIYKKSLKKTKKICANELKKCLALIKNNKMKGMVEYAVDTKYEKYWIDIMYYLIKKLRKMNYVVFYRQPNNINIFWQIDIPISKDEKMIFLAKEHAISKKKLKY